MVKKKKKNTIQQYHPGRILAEITRKKMITL